MQHVIGENNLHAKLSELQAFMIKCWIIEGFSNTSIAKAFNVDPCTISHIKNNRTWKHVVV
jgi:IS30 family transposase